MQNWHAIETETAYRRQEWERAAAADARAALAHTAPTPSRRGWFPRLPVPGLPWDSLSLTRFAIAARRSPSCDRARRLNCVTSRPQTESNHGRPHEPRSCSRLADPACGNVAPLRRRESRGIHRAGVRSGSGRERLTRILPSSPSYLFLPLHSFHSSQSPRADRSRALHSPRQTMFPPCRPGAHRPRPWEPVRRWRVVVRAPAHGPSNASSSPWAPDTATYACRICAATRSSSSWEGVIDQSAERPKLSSAKRGKTCRWTWKTS